MLPVIDLGFIKVYSYSFFVLLGFVCYLIILLINVEKREKNDKKIGNKLLLISILCFAILYFGALIMNSIFQSIEKGRIIIGGITWLGGVLIAFPLTIYIIYKLIPEKRGSANEIFNIILPGIIIAHGFGRIGCFLGGCCYGEPTTLSIGVIYPKGSLAAIQYPDYETGNSLPLFPTQLIEAIFEFCLGTVLLINLKLSKKFGLQIYAVCYGLFRFFLEFSRGDSRGSTGFFLSPSQLMSCILIVISIIAYLIKNNIIMKNYIRKVIERDNKKYIKSIKNRRDYYITKLFEEKIISLEECRDLKKRIENYNLIEKEKNIENQNLI